MRKDHWRAAPPALLQRSSVVRSRVVRAGPRSGGRRSGLGGPPRRGAVCRRAVCRRLRPAGRWPVRRRRRRTARPGWPCQGELPKLPSDASRLGAVPGSQTLHLDVSLAGQNPAGLSEEVAAVSTPGSPSYHHYLTSAQFAAAYGPSPAEVQQVSTTLRAEGLTVGTPTSGSTLLPVSGTAHTVSAVFDTPLESVRLPGHVTSMVNTAAPEIPAALADEITGVVGLSGLSQEHALLRRDARRPSLTIGTASRGHDRQHDRPGQRPPGLSGRGDRGGQRGRLHVDAVGRLLRTEPTLRAGSHRHRADHRHRRVRAVLQRRRRRLPGLLRPEQPGPHRRRRWDAQRVALGIR